MTAPIVLLGANGGLGRRLRARLGAQAQVIEVDRDLQPGYDLADPQSVQALHDVLPDSAIAINVMGVVTTGMSTNDVTALVRSNVQAVGSLASGLADKVTHLIHLSSVSVYGSLAANPISEAQAPSPDTVYGVTEHAAEQLLQVICRATEIPLTIFRSTQLVALPSAHETLPHSLVSRLRAGERPTLTVDPASRRDYLHVDDAAALIARSALHPKAGTFNMGSGTGLRLDELFRAAYDAVGQAPPDHPGGTETSQWLDINAVRDAFGWSPSTDILAWIRDGAPDAG